MSIFTQIAPTQETQYLQDILKKYAVDIRLSLYYKSFFSQYISEWAGSNLKDIIVSGSSAKGTAVSNGVDVDLFISLYSQTRYELSVIYNDLFNFMTRKRFQVRKQNVSIGITHNNYQIDLVPAKLQSSYGSDHSLYVSKKNTWTKTNINTHIIQIKNSNRINEIKLVKIWRNLNGLDFPSFYLELIVINALRFCKFGDIANNFFKALTFISDNIENKVYYDPANTNNCISAQMTLFEKQKIAKCAKESVSKQYWKEIVY